MSEEKIQQISKEQTMGTDINQSEINNDSQNVIINNNQQDSDKQSQQNNEQLQNKQDSDYHQELIEEADKYDRIEIQVINKEDSNSDDCSKRKNSIEENLNLDPKDHEQYLENKYFNKSENEVEQENYNVNQDTDQEYNLETLNDCSQDNQQDQFQKKVQFDDENTQQINQVKRDENDDQQQIEKKVQQEQQEQQQQKLRQEDDEFEQISNINNQSFLNSLNQASLIKSQENSDNQYLNDNINNSEKHYFDISSVQKLRQSFNNNFQNIYQQPDGQSLLEDLEHDLENLELLSDDFLSEKTSQISSDELNITNNTIQSIRPQFYIPQAMKDKLEVMMVNFNKNLAVLSHQKMVLIWVAVRLYEKNHMLFWEKLQQEFGGHLIMRRYCDENFFLQDIKNKYYSHPIILLISGFCGQRLVPMIYNQYRFKGIVVLTDDYGMKLNEQWVKKYSRITLLTQSFEQSSKELTKLVNNTLFRGACKFKDLDHFLGKQKKIQSYFLKTQDQMKQYANINEYRKNRKNFKQGSQLNVIYEEIQQINDNKEKDEDQILNEEINEDIKHEMKFQNIISFYNRQKLKEKPSYKELQKKKKDQIKNSQKGIIQDNSILILNSFDDASKDYDFYLNKLYNARDIIKNRNILIRNDMLEEKCLQNIAKLYVECFNSDSQEQIVKNILNLYTKKETELYAIVNCALNTLNESLIMELQDIIKCLRYCLQEYDDQDDYFQLGQVINLWRGCTYDREYFQKFFKVGEYIVFPGYASTSTDLQESLKFSKLGNEKRIIFQLEFVCDEKMMKYRPKNLKNISAYPQENEFLLNCFSIFYIEEINPDYQDGYLLYKLKMIQ